VSFISSSLSNSSVHCPFEHPRHHLRVAIDQYLGIMQGLTLAQPQAIALLFAIIRHPAISQKLAMIHSTQFSLLTIYIFFSHSSFTLLSWSCIGVASGFANDRWALNLDIGVFRHSVNGLPQNGAARLWGRGRG
jgi:hypothetical protein